VKVDLTRVSAPLKAPLETSHGPVGRRDLVLLTLGDEEGLSGWGEAAPLESYDGVTVDDVLAALEDCRELLRGADGHEPAEVIAACRQIAVLPQALAAIDLALWDLAGRRARQPVWRLLGGAAAIDVEVNYTLSAADRAGASAEAAGAMAAGFRCLKAKVGIGDDAGRLAAIRASAGPEMTIRLDANGAWSVTEAAAALRALASVGIELCEEPVHGLEEVAELGELTDVPLGLDESASLPGALDRRWCAAVGLKLSRAGGISGLVDTAARARAAGYEVYLTSTYDGPLGIAAALHAATVIAPDRPCGLATLGMFAAGDDPLPARAGRIAVPRGPGLGDGLRAWYGT
jgi:L-alanine-DL-glutamate epimerase-like enolase superfamily enzyme